MRKPRLMTPGPAMVPEDVLLELARPVIHHRSNEFKQVLTEVVAGLKEVFQTQERRLDPDGLGNRGDGSGGRQRRSAGRQGAGAQRRSLRGAVGQPVQGVRLELRLARHGVGPAGRPRARGGSLAAKPRHHLCLRYLERDLDRHGPPDRSDRPDRRQDPGPPCHRRHFGRRGDGVPHRQVGNRPSVRRLSESTDDSAGIGVRGGQPQGLGQDRRVRLAQLLLQPEGRPEEDEGVRHTLYAGAYADSGPGRRARADQGRRDRKRLGAPSPDE